MEVYWKMKYSFEVPIHSLEEMDDHQDYIFILGQHLKNKRYYNYCKRSRKKKILDNGAYELGESIDPVKLKRYAEELNVRTIIIPDKLFDKKRSLELEKQFKKLFTEEERKKYKFMKVVCGNNLKEYLKSLKEVSKDPDIDIVGISQSRTIIAPNLTFVMNEYRGKKPVHLLGLTHPYELLEASKFKIIESIDTGRPINFAFKKKLFPIISKNIEYKKESGLDIDTRKILDTELAKLNIITLKYYEKHY
jgi:hypothetical protein